MTGMEHEYKNGSNQFQWSGPREHVTRHVSLIAEMEKCKTNFDEFDLRV